MSQRKKQQRSGDTSSSSNLSPAPASKKGNRGLIVAVAVVLLLGLGTALPLKRKADPASRSAEAPLPKITGPVTYSKDIAPIIFKNCAGCHRPGQAGPFDLLTYADAKKHARDIAEVTAHRYMPPWLPEKGYGEFDGERRLTEQELAIIQHWVKEGAVEGNTNDLPPLPEWKSGWELGEPDLIVETQPYTLPAEGQDIYYNFVVPIPNSTTRFVEGVEFLPGNNRVVHHAFVNIDETRGARRAGASGNPPGFLGMNLPETVGMPGGQLLGWQPGKIPRLATQGLAWILRTNTDLVLQLHMNPSGKPETVRPKVGFHFTDHPPTNVAFRVRLTALELDIPAGESNYVVESSYTLPVDLSMVRVGGHAHYLGKEMQGYATLPNGEKKWLLMIKDWDFKWQGDYQYKEPVFLPKGSVLTMRFTYDNSTNNVRNPHHPPKRVRWGLQTTDEMGELYFQAMPSNQADYVTLRNHYSVYFLQVSMNYYRFRIKNDPKDADAYQRLGRALASIGQMDEGLGYLKEAVRLEPWNDLAHYDLGAIYLRQKKLAEAYASFKEVTRLKPGDAEAFGSLGIICLQTGRLDEGREHLRTALRINPDDALAKRYLDMLEARQR